MYVYIIWDLNLVYVCYIHGWYIYHRIWFNRWHSPAIFSNLNYETYECKNSQTERYEMVLHKHKYNIVNSAKIIPIGSVSGIINCLPVVRFCPKSRKKKYMSLFTNAYILYYISLWQNRFFFLPCAPGLPDQYHGVYNFPVLSVPLNTMIYKKKS